MRSQAVPFFIKSLFYRAVVCVCLLQLVACAKDTSNLITEEALIVKEKDISMYFQAFTPYNRLVQLSEPVVHKITHHHPRLDGATAAIPLYAAVAEALYTNIDSSQARSLIQYSTTGPAYEKLIQGEVDIIFVAQPSREQIERAQIHGVEFELTPIARDAFVFITHSSNSVSSLSVEQVQKIYKGTITQWNQVGGDFMRITPFQREKGSGSQTTMKEKVMKGHRMISPLEYENQHGMGALIRSVADYRNYPHAIGYTFRYYLDDFLRSKDDIKMLAINGVSPTLTNIRSGAYPFTTELFMVTRKEKHSEEMKKLMKWMISPQGQRLVQAVGTVPVHPTK